MTSFISTKSWFHDNNDNLKMFPKFSYKNENWFWLLKLLFNQFLTTSMQLKNTFFINCRYLIYLLQRAEPVDENRKSDVLGMWTTNIWMVLWVKLRDSMYILQWTRWNETNGTLVTVPIKRDRNSMSLTFNRYTLSLCAPHTHYLFLLVSLSTFLNIKYTDYFLFLFLASWLEPSWRALLSKNL